VAGFGFASTGGLINDTFGLSSLSDKRQHVVFAKLERGET
jgi:hypothetical protein